MSLHRRELALPALFERSPLARQWFGLALAVLVLAGLFALAVVIGRMPPFDRFVTDPALLQALSRRPREPGAGRLVLLVRRARCSSLLPTRGRAGSAGPTLGRDVASAGVAADARRRRRPGRAAGARELHPDHRPLALPARPARCSARVCSRASIDRRSAVRAAASAPTRAAMPAARAIRPARRSASPSRSQARRFAVSALRHAVGSRARRAATSCSSGASGTCSSSCACSRWSRSGSCC